MNARPITMSRKRKRKRRSYPVRPYQQSEAAKKQFYWSNISYGKGEDPNLVKLANGKNKSHQLWVHHRPVRGEHGEAIRVDDTIARYRPTSGAGSHETKTDEGDTEEDLDDAVPTNFDGNARSLQDYLSWGEKVKPAVPHVEHPPPLRPIHSALKDAELVWQRLSIQVNECGASEPQIHS